MQVNDGPSFAAGFQHLHVVLAPAVKIGPVSRGAGLIVIRICALTFSFRFRRCRRARAELIDPAPPSAPSLTPPVENSSVGARSGSKQPPSRHFNRLLPPVECKGSWGSDGMPRAQRTRPLCSTPPMYVEELPIPATRSLALKEIRVSVPRKFYQRRVGTNGSSNTHPALWR